MSREQDFLLGAIEKDKVIAQQQARIEALTLEVACLSDGPTTDEWQEWLAAERERAEKAEGMVQWWKEEARHMEDVLQAEREKSAALHQRFAEAVQAKERLERQLERHATLLHSANHNWKLYRWADCPEVECEEYRALLSPAPEEK